MMYPGATIHKAKINAKKSTTHGLEEWALIKIFMAKCMLFFRPILIFKDWEVSLQLQISQPQAVLTTMIGWEMEPCLWGYTWNSITLIFQSLSKKWNHMWIGLETSKQNMILKVMMFASTLNFSCLTVKSI